MFNPTPRNGINLTPFGSGLDLSVYLYPAGSTLVPCVLDRSFPLHISREIPQIVVDPTETCSQWSFSEDCQESFKRTQFFGDVYSPGPISFVGGVSGVGTSSHHCSPRGICRTKRPIGGVTMGMAQGTDVTHYLVQSASARGSVTSSQMTESNNGFLSTVATANPPAIVLTYGARDGN